MNSTQLARFERKARLLARSEAGRSALAAAGDDWLDRTASADRVVGFVAEHRTAILIGSAALLLYAARGRRPAPHDDEASDAPSTAGWLARALVALRLVRTLQTLVRYLPRPRPRGLHDMPPVPPPVPRGLG